MPSATRPTVLLIPGAFTTPTTIFRPLIPKLESAGFTTILAHLPSSHPSASNDSRSSSEDVTSDDYQSCTIAADAQHVRAQILDPLIHVEKRKVIVLAHSYGAVVSGAAAVELTPRSMSSGGGEGVLGLLNVAGMLLPEGVSLIEADRRGAAGGHRDGFCELMFSSFWWGRPDDSTTRNSH